MNSLLNSSRSFSAFLFSEFIWLNFVSKFSKTLSLNCLILSHCESNISIFLLIFDIKLLVSILILFILLSLSKNFSLVFNSNFFNNSLQYKDNLDSIKLISSLNCPIRFSNFSLYIFISLFCISFDSDKSFNLLSTNSKKSRVFGNWHRSPINPGDVKLLINNLSYLKVISCNSFSKKLNLELLIILNWSNLNLIEDKSDFIFICSSLFDIIFIISKILLFCSDIISLFFSMFSKNKFNWEFIFSLRRFSNFVRSSKTSFLKNVKSDFFTSIFIFDNFYIF